VTLEGIARLGYDAVNLGSSDFFFGPDYLEDMASSFSVPFVSTNVLPVTENEPWFKNYLVKEINGIKIGILGLISPESFEALPNRDEITGIRVVPPALVLKEAVPGIREKVDVVLLLSQLTPEETGFLLDEVSGIDVAIVACTSEECGRMDVEDLEKVENPPLLLCAQEKGITLGSIEILKSSDRPIQILRVERIDLGDSVPHDPEMDALIDNAHAREKQEQERKKHEEEQRIIEDAVKGLKLTPEEFFKQQKENPSRRPGTDQEQDNP
jgi:2',3'-cyclic-nucleotide 2'-phosphodiesterase (5'-nucleotidase family)